MKKFILPIMVAVLTVIIYSGSFNFRKNFTPIAVKTSYSNVGTFTYNGVDYLALTQGPGHSIDAVEYLDTGDIDNSVVGGYTPSSPDAGTLNVYFHPVEGSSTKVHFSGGYN